MDNNMGRTMQSALQSKEQEFIDHSLLAPTYIRDSNNFIIELIDNPVVFPKTVVHTETTSAGAYDVKDTITTDMHFQNSIFHPVETVAVQDNDSSLRTIAPSALQSVSTGNETAFDEKNTSNFGLTLNNDFLRTSDNKSFCNTTPKAHSNTTATYSSLSLLTEPAVTLNETDVMHGNGDILYAAQFSNSRKVLPHKKRISRKLKVDHNLIESSISATALQQHKLPEHDLSSVGTVHFSCEICGKSTSSQLAFFAHLKEHYEPSTPDTILAAMKTSLDELGGPIKNCDAICSITKKADEQMFQDVQLNFEDFQNVEESVNSNSIDKCISYVTDNDTRPLKGIVTEEVEFSDPEDMLEGIRNVVDKVSIDDTCDSIDLMGPNGIRAPWFADDNFSGGIPYKSNTLREVAFSESIAPMTITESRSDIMEVSSKPQLSLNGPTSPKSNDESYDKLAHPKNAKLQPKLRKIAHQRSIVISDDECDPNDRSCEEEDPQFEENMSKEGKNNYFCTKCNRKFNSSNALKYHSGTHSEVRPHQCNQCSKAFFAQSALKSHIRTHTGDKPFECDQCQRKFRQWGDLKYHTISIHTKEKSHQCEFCGKAFSRKYSLVLHRRIHTSERNYKCEYCPKTFRASVYLQNHRKIHTGEKPFECKVCTKKFRISGDLSRHKRVHQRKSISSKAETSKINHSSSQFGSL